MKNETKTVTLNLTVEELDLIRHATWSLESKIEKDIEIGHVQQCFWHCIFFIYDMIFIKNINFI